MTFLLKQPSYLVLIPLIGWDCDILTEYNHVYSGLLRDKTIDDKFIHISHEDKLEYHVCNCILKFLVETFGNY